MLFSKFDSVVRESQTAKVVFDIRARVIEVLRLWVDEYLPELTYSKELSDKMLTFVKRVYADDPSITPTLEIQRLKTLIMSKSEKQETLRDQEWGAKVDLDMSRRKYEKFNILDVDATVMADSLTKIDVRTLSSVHPSELSIFFLDTNVTKYAPTLVSLYQQQERVCPFFFFPFP